MKLDPAVAEAVEGLSPNKNFQLFLDWLEAQAATETNRALMATDGNADLLRGRAQFAVELVESVHGSPDFLRRLLDARRRPIHHGPQRGF